jgi:hypothetical protein
MPLAADIPSIIRSKREGAAERQGSDQGPPSASAAILFSTFKCWSNAKEGDYPLLCGHERYFTKAILFRGMGTPLATPSLVK